MPTSVVGLPEYVPHEPFVNGAESRVSVLAERPEAVPDGVSAQSMRLVIAKLPAESLVDPPPEATVPLTVTAPPVGAVLSAETVKVDAADDVPAPFRAVTDRAPGSAAPAAKT